MNNCDLLAKSRELLLTGLKKINLNGKGIIFIVNDDDRICGIVTDGDIRRALLAGATLETKLNKIMNPNFVYAHYYDNKKTILGKFNEKVTVLPLVNDNMHVVDYFELQAGVRVPVAEPYLKENEFKYAVDAILSTWISSNGQYIKDFETKFSSYCGDKYGVATSNGTTALHLALISLGIGKGDEVIVPNLTFAATINVVLHAGANPVIVDVENDGWCIDPQKIEEAITSRTKAIIPVHLYGQPCDMGLVMKIAKKYNLFVIEDCAEAHGAEFAGKKVGSFGDIGCFSFFGNKVITTGEGGMCITNDKDIYERLLIYRDHGMSKTKKYWHEVVGYNYRMTNIQAAIGVAQVERIDSLLVERTKIEDEYNRILGKVANISLQKRDLVDRKKIPWLISILVKADKRDSIMEKMKQAGIDVRPFFYPLSEMNIYKKYSFGDLKNSKIISYRGINLPTVIGMNINVIEKIKDILEKDTLERE